MKKCLITSRGKPSRFVLICLVSILLVFVWVTQTEMLDTILFPLFVGLCIMWLAVILSYIILLLIWSRTYAITRDGITITDGTTWKRFFPWDSFSDISICNVHYTSRKPYEYDAVIRLSVMDEPAGPKSGVWGRWTSELYEVTHFRRIFVISFTEERLRELELLCGREIQDHRGIRRNAFDTQ